MSCLEAADHAGIFIPHAFAEQTVDLCEIRMNYAVAGDASNPALLLIPAQTESWWGYEDAMRLLANRYQVYAVDLRGQGRSTWTPGRYSLDIVGGDLVRFIDRVIARPVVVSGLSSGGTIAAWLSAFAAPGQVLAAVYEDAPLFASEADPAVGRSIRQRVGPMFRLWHKWLGPQWSIGDFAGMQAAMVREVPGWMLAALRQMAPAGTGQTPADIPAGPPQDLVRKMVSDRKTRYLRRVSPRHQGWCPVRVGAHRGVNHDVDMEGGITRTEVGHHIESSALRGFLQGGARDLETEIILGTVAVLGAGQLLMHLVLNTLMVHSAPRGGEAMPGSAMAATHTGATIVTAFLVVRAEAMLRAAASAMRLLLPKIFRALSVPAAAVQPTLVLPAGAGRLLEVLFRDLHGRRGPPIYS